MMTLQIDTDDSFTAPSIEYPTNVFFGGWADARYYVGYRPAAPTPASESEDAKDEAAINIFAPQVGLRNKAAACRARRRLNRTFRRNQREFDNAMDAVAHDPGGQRELQTSWTLGH